MIKKIFALLLISAVLFTACKKDEDNNLSTQDSKTTLTAAGNDINTDLTEITSSDGAKSITDIINIININDPFTGTQKSVKISARHFSYLSKLVYIPRIERKSGGFGNDKFEESKLLLQTAWRIDPRLQPVPISTESFNKKTWVPLIHQIKASGIEIKAA